MPETLPEYIEPVQIEKLKEALAQNRTHKKVVGRNILLIELDSKTGLSSICSGWAEDFSPEGAETFVLCRSTERAQKEKAIHDRFEKRIEKGLEKIAESCRKRKLRIGSIEIRGSPVFTKPTLVAVLLH